jgi:hypothetical protein
LGFRRQNHRKSFCGPRALAVISCALALLAAQPLMADSQPRSSEPVLLRDAGTLGGATLAESAAQQTPESKTTRARQQQSFLASARRMHVLATVEIFQRLLMAELRVGGAERHVLPGMFLQPVCIEILPPASLIPGRGDPSPILPPPMAQSFAIRHCLLAPPTV